LPWAAPGRIAPGGGALCLKSKKLREGASERKNLAGLPLPIIAEMDKK